MERWLDKILIFSILLFLILLGVLIYFIYFKPQPLRGLTIELNGAKEVFPLDINKYQVMITNKSNVKITNTSLKISLSNGAWFNQNQSKELSIFIGDIEPQQTFSKDLELYFLNEGDIKEEIKLSFYYKIENKPHVFETNKSFDVIVKSTPIKIQTFVPSKIYVNQQFQTSFSLTNLTKQKLDNVQAFIEVPNQFLIVSTFPQNETYLWDLGSLEPGETKTISLIGQIQDIKSSDIFAIKVNFTFQNQQFSLPKEFAKINILENPVSFTININPPQDSVPIGSNLMYEITIENKSQTVLQNNEVKVTFYGPFDLHSLDSDGYLNEFERSLYWNPRNKPELLILKPGSQVKFNFNISLFQSYPILSDKDKNFTAKIRVEFKTPTIPAEIENPTSKEYVVYREIEKKIIGKIEINQWLAYEKKYFPSRGPFPLESNKKTTLNWHIVINTLGEDFENFTLFTKLPFGVNLTGNVGGDALKENLKFDPISGNFWYSIQNLPANLGYLQKNLELIFQIEVTPPADENINSWVIIPTVQYSAKGAFSQANLTSNLIEISAYYIQNQ